MCESVIVMQDVMKRFLYLVGCEKSGVMEFDVLHNMITKSYTEFSPGGDYDVAVIMCDTSLAISNNIMRDISIPSGGFSAHDQTMLQGSVLFACPCVTTQYISFTTNMSPSNTLFKGGVTAASAAERVAVLTNKGEWLVISRQSASKSAAPVVRKATTPHHAKLAVSQPAKTLARPKTGVKKKGVVPTGR
jgi:hypothetical protein